MYNKKHYHKDSLFYQIQKMIAIEGLSLYVMEIYIRHDKHNKPKLLASFTNIPNQFCICQPERVDRYFNMPTKILKKVSRNVVNFLATERYYQLIDEPFYQN